MKALVKSFEEKQSQIESLLEIVEQDDAGAGVEVQEHEADVPEPPEPTDSDTINIPI